MDSVNKVLMSKKIKHNKIISNVGSILHQHKGVSTGGWGEGRTGQDGKDLLSEVIFLPSNFSENFFLPWATSGRYLHNLASS